MEMILGQLREYIPLDSFHRLNLHQNYQHFFNHLNGFMGS